MKQNGYVKAVKAAFPYTIPVLTGYLFIGIAFGVMYQEKGYNFLWAILMSILVYAGSGQYLAVNFFAPGVSFLQIIFLEFMVNNFESYLNNAGNNSLASIFQKAADTYGVSVSLLTAMAKQESNFQTNATSKSGAMGIMQLMPSTASYFGCTDPYDPEQNIMAGAKYISELLNKYNGDTSLALAAYNAGSGNVAKYGGIPPFKETQNYVAKITGYMQEGVTLPDGTAVAASANSNAAYNAGTVDNSLSVDQWDSLEQDALQDILDRFFNYDDYLRFLNMFMKFM